MTETPRQPQNLPEAPATDPREPAIQPLPDRSPERSIVLIGLMGAGKTTVGRRIAQKLGLPFVDADHEIEAAAGETIPEIFERRGEVAFREGERRVIARLLEDGPQVLATGGGAFMDPTTRANIAARGVSIWLRADLDVLMRRVSRRNNRPLLKQGDPRATMERLIDERYPIYAAADITIESVEGPHEIVVDDVITQLNAWREAPATETEPQRSEESTK
ncbi:MAG: shikimate kinase [Parvibaculum sp.]